MIGNRTIFSHCFRRFLKFRRICLPQIHCKRNYHEKQFNPEVLDPAFSCRCLNPPEPFDRNDPHFWLYLRGENDLFQLELCRKTVRQAHLLVGYRGTVPLPLKTVFFRTAAPAGTLHFQACGTCRAVLNGKPAAESDESDGIRTLRLSEPGELVLELSVADPAADIPALRPMDPGIWEVSADGHAWNAPETLPPMFSGAPPHTAGLPELPLAFRQLENGLCDLGREALVRIEIESGESPVLHVGESMAEALSDDPKSMEQSCEMVPSGKGRHVTANRLACRFFRIGNAGKVSRISCMGAFAPLCWKGAFSWTSESNAVWSASAYTLRLCTQYFTLDGIKRDRMPWGGDLADALVSNAFVFAEPAPIRRTLRLLGTNIDAGEDINRIVDYSMWFAIAHDWFQLYFAEPDFLREEYPRIVRCMESLNARYDSGTLGAVLRGPNTMVLIDWGEPIVENALKALYVWSLKSAAKLAVRTGDSVSAAEWRNRAEKVSDFLRKNCMSPEGLFYSDSPDRNKAFGRHVNMFAVLAGIAAGKQAARIADWLSGNEVPDVATPYMAVWNIMAISKGGFPERAVRKLECLWEPMLDRGATTFWEGFSASDRGNENYIFYSRPFGKSLCHAWSSGPAFALPQIIFGLEPLSDGWKTFSIRKRISGFEGAETAVPVPGGFLKASVHAGRVECTHPDACTPAVI